MPKYTRESKSAANSLISSCSRHCFVGKVIKWKAFILIISWHCHLYAVLYFLLNEKNAFEICKILLLLSKIQKFMSFLCIFNH